MGIYITILEQGLIYGILALGVYITYKILDFPDLTVDGSFPLGAALTATMITRGVHPILTLPASFLIGVLAVLWGIIRTLWKPAFDKGIWFAGAGTVLTVLALLLVAGYNNTAYYPSTADLQSSLTLANSCSSQFTLRVMAYVSILVPFVLAYIFYAWRSIDRKKIDAKEMQDEGGHAY